MSILGTPYIFMSLHVKKHGKVIDKLISDKQKFYPIDRKIHKKNIF